jgi:hypothetical protein
MNYWKRWQISLEPEFTRMRIMLVAGFCNENLSAFLKLIVALHGFIRTEALAKAKEVERLLGSCFTVSVSFIF